MNELITFRKYGSAWRVAKHIKGDSQNGGMLLDFCATKKSVAKKYPAAVEWDQWLVTKFISA